MSRPLWFVELIKKSFPGRFLAAKMTRVPLVGRLMDHMFFEGDEIYFLPREQTIQVDADIEEPGGTVLPSEVVDHFIEESGFRWIMDRCICRDASGCEDYPVELGCLFLGEAARDINPRLGRPATREEALEHVRKCREAGLFHLIGRNKIDTAWLKVGPGEKLLTVCNCCPCCCLWRILPDVSEKIRSKVNRMPGLEVRVGDDCNGCGSCTDACIAGAITVVDGRARVSEGCIGCGRCAEVCPRDAMELVFEEGVPVEESIRRLESRVDVS